MGLPVVAFNSINVAELAQHKVGASGATSWLAKVWRDLERKFEEWESGIQDTARQAGLTIYAWPKKTPGAGGAGNSSTYSIEFCSLPPTGKDVETGIPEGCISYVQELTLKPAFWIRPLLKPYYVLTGWRRNAFIIFGVAVIISMGLALIWLWLALNIAGQAASPGFIVTLLLIATMIVWFGVSILRPLSVLADRRIIMAPDVLVSFRELHVQLELAREKPEDAEPFKLIRLVRYSAKCGICGETVHLSDGRLEFPERLVGRCEEHPTEHVYSFDRYNKIGRPLR